MSTDLVRQPTMYAKASLEERTAWAQRMAGAGDLLPSHLQGGTVRDQATNQLVKVGSAGKVFMIAETGDMLGIHPMAALTGVHIIEGKPAISANLMNGLVRNAGHKLRVESKGTVKGGDISITVTLIRHDDPDYPFVATWDLEKATRAGLWPGKDKSNWQKYPEAMLLARATSEVVRMGASDVLMGGNIYLPEELGAEVNEQGEPINLTVQEPAPQEPRQAPRQAPIVDPDMQTPQPTQAEAPTPPEQAAPTAAADNADPQTGEIDPKQWWIEQIVAAETAEQVRALYKSAQHSGLLAMPIRIGNTEKSLGDMLFEVGSALAEKEERAAAEGEEPAVEATVDDDGADTGPAVLADPNIQDAEVVNE